MNVDVAKCHACHTNGRVVHGNQVRHQSQPSAISATPATQSEGRCHVSPSAMPATQNGGEGVVCEGVVREGVVCDGVVCEGVVCERIV